MNPFNFPNRFQSSCIYHQSLKISFSFIGKTLRKIKLPFPLNTRKINFYEMKIFLIYDLFESLCVNSHCKNNIPGEEISAQGGIIEQDNVNSLHCHDDGPGYLRNRSRLPENFSGRSSVAVT